MSVVANDPNRTDEDYELVNRLRHLYTLARSSKREKYDNWTRNYKLVHNRMGGQTSQSWAPAPRDSEIYPVLSSLAAWMTDQHTNIDISAAADPHSPYTNFMNQIATDLSTLMQTNWVVDDYNVQIKLAVWDAFQYGAGFFKSVWDQSLAGGLGNCMLKRVDPWALYIDPNATSLDDAEYICEARRMSLDEIERRFPGSSSLLESLGSSDTSDIDERPKQYDTDQSRVPKANPGSLANTAGVFGESRNASGVGNVRYSAKKEKAPYLSTGIVVYEFWLRENDEWWDDETDQEDSEHPPRSTSPEYDAEMAVDTEKHVTDRWRVVVLAANQILLDEYADELWSYAKHPYERFVYEETGELYGISLVDHLAHPQIYINRLLTALEQNAELVGNPIFIEGANSGLGRTNIQNKPGQRLTVNTAAMQSPNKPDWLQPPSMPPSVKDLVDFWVQRIENISGLSAAIKGGGGAAQSRTPEGVVSTIQEAAFVRVRAALANLETTLKRSTAKLADLIIDNYTEPRIVAIIGPTGQKTSLALSARHFVIPTQKGALPLQYSIIVQAGASMPTSRQARIAEVDKAYALGIVDRQAWFEAHQYPNWQAVLDRVQKAEAAGMFNPPGQRKKSGRQQ